MEFAGMVKIEPLNSHDEESIEEVVTDCSNYIYDIPIEKIKKEPPDNLNDQSETEGPMHQLVDVVIVKMESNDQDTGTFEPEQPTSNKSQEQEHKEDKPEDSEPNDIKSNVKRKTFIEKLNEKSKDNLRTWLKKCSAV
ncbi:unnamed protein product [Arctia plantaginis]|uniref:Uncharacterized protein n=1 Tax=Arctia plantaginis TaxID=874455 RepID=A0A8S1AZJ7_ARCPL|nr:unnamed protein product [Arctia plantaginis]